MTPFSLSLTISRGGATCPTFGGQHGQPPVPRDWVVVSEPTARCPFLVPAGGPGGAHKHRGRGKCGKVQGRGTGDAGRKQKLSGPHTECRLPCEYSCIQSSCRCIYKYYLSPCWITSCSFTIDSWGGNQFGNIKAHV